VHHGRLCTKSSIIDDFLCKWLRIEQCLLPEPLSVFSRGDERLDHVGIDEVAAMVVELCQPEVVPLIVERKLRRIRPKIFTDSNFYDTVRPSD
jgi:hypothetical protein